MAASDRSGGSLRRIAFVAAEFGGDLGKFGTTAVGVCTTPWRADSSLINATSLAGGAVAVTTRGGCSFVDKAIRAQEAGACGIVIVNTEDTPPLRIRTSLNSTTGHLVTIPVVGVGSAFEMQDVESLLASLAAVAPAHDAERRAAKAKRMDMLDLGLFNPKSRWTRYTNDRDGRVFYHTPREPRRMNEPDEGVKAEYQHDDDTFSDSYALMLNRAKMIEQGLLGAHSVARGDFW